MQGIYVLTAHGTKHRKEIAHVVFKRIYFAVNYYVKRVEL